MKMLLLALWMALSVAVTQAAPTQPSRSQDYNASPEVGWDPFGPPPGMTDVKPDVAADGDGIVWAIFSRMGPTITQFQDGLWKDLKLSEFSGSLNAQKLVRLADGRVACLWSDGSRENAWQISLHRRNSHSMWSRFTIKWERPRMLPLADGGLLITEAGRQVVRISPDGGHVNIAELPEEVFIRPKKNYDGSVSTSHRDIHAVQDQLGGIWLWCFALKPYEYEWQLRGLLKLDGGKVERKKIGIEDGSALISAVVPWQKDKLAVAVAGVGLFELDLNGVNTKRFEDASGELKYIEKIFHANDAWHFITTPRPTEMDVSVSKTFNAHLQSSNRRFYDPEKRTTAILRLESSKIIPLAWKVDVEPEFGWADRPVVETPDGFWTCTRGAGLLFVALGNGGPVLRNLDWRSGLRLREPDLITRARDSQLVVLEKSVRKATVFPLRASSAEIRPLRVDVLNTKSLLLEDAQGSVWGRLDDGSMQRWKNGWWEKPKIPDKVEAMRANLFVADDAQQGWLMPLHEGGAAVCDFTTGQWQVFDTLEQALLTRLKAGSRLHLRDYPSLAPVSAPGQIRCIGFLRQEGRLHHFDGAKWQVWKLSDFAGPDARVTGVPSFDEAGAFTIPINQVYWKLRKSGGWEQTAENAESAARTYLTTESNPPPGCPLKEVGSTAYDRFGVCWLTDDKGRLWKSIHGCAVPVIQPEEPNPVSNGMSVYEVRTDLAGNAFLRLESDWYGGRHLVVRSRQPRPESTAVVNQVKADTASIAFGDAAWHVWRMDGGESIQPRYETHALPATRPLSSVHCFR
jgi:hypothetical protein